jgi:hypothetical protein
MRFSHSHGGTSAEKWAANAARDGGNVKNSAAFNPATQTGLRPPANKKAAGSPSAENGAGEEVRTLDVHLGNMTRCF